LRRKGSEKRAEKQERHMRKITGEKQNENQRISNYIIIQKKDA
jgi:hypothetical protein